MSSSTYNVNDNGDDLVRGFDASIFSGDSVYDTFDNKDYIITEDCTIWANTNKQNLGR